MVAAGRRVAAITANAVTAAFFCNVWNILGDFKAECGPGDPMKADNFVFAGIVIDFMRP